MDNNKNINIVEQEVKKVFKSREENVIEKEKIFDDTVTIEHELKLNIDDKVERYIICTNSDIKEFIIGHLFTQGYINKYDDIKQIDLNDDNTFAKVIFNDNLDIDISGHLKNLNIVTTGANYVDKNVDSKKIEKLNLDKDNIDFPKEKMLKMMNNSKILLDSNELFKITGCLHAAALAFDDELKYFAVDLGRHNAVDKVIGKAILNGNNIEEAVLYTTGRIPTDMITKVIKSKIKIVVTRAACTYNAIQLARQNKVHLIAFSRGESINIFS